MSQVFTSTVPKSGGGFTGTVTITPGSGNTALSLVGPSLGDSAGNIIHSGSGLYSWLVGPGTLNTDVYSITPSTAVGGSTFSNSVLRLEAGGALTLGNATLAGAVTIPVSTAASSKTAAALVVTGGIGCSGTLYTNKIIADSGDSVVVAPTANPFLIKALTGNSNGLRLYSNTATDVSSVVNGYNAALELGANNTVFQTISAAGSVVVGAGAVATNATDGFLYIPTCAGTPTGVPTAYAGRVAMVFDTTNNKLYIYDGSWLGGTAPGAFS